MGRGVQIRMKNFDRIFAAVIILFILIFCLTNIVLLSGKNVWEGRPYLVEINRLAYEIENDGFGSVNTENCIYVKNIAKFEGVDEYPDIDFFEEDSDYQIRIINGDTYRFDYVFNNKESEQKKIIILVNVILLVVSFIIILLMVFLRRNIIKPFDELKNIPYELSKGNLTTPIKENKYRFFGRFVWGINILRENIEHQRQQKLHLLRQQKTLVLSLSHDIKTPLSAIKLYSKALEKGLYDGTKKQAEIVAGINSKTDEIEKYVSDIMRASSEDFLELEVKTDEFYLSSLEGKITDFYKEKLELIKTDFSVGRYNDCIMNGDLDRSVEVLQNIIENAIKYGDGRNIEIIFAEEDGCVMITVKNSGCTLSDTELPHIFDSFWRGANAENVPGNGLGLYICRQLMNKMDGEIFAEIIDGNMFVTAVFVMGHV